MYSGAYRHNVTCAPIYMAVRGRKLTGVEVNFLEWSASPICFTHVAVKTILIYSLETVVKTVD